MRLLFLCSVLFMCMDVTVAGAPSMASSFAKNVKKSSRYANHKSMALPRRAHAIAQFRAPDAPLPRPVRLSTLDRPLSSPVQNGDLFHAATPQQERNVLIVQLIHRTLHAIALCLCLCLLVTEALLFLRIYFLRQTGQNGVRTRTGLLTRFARLACWHIQSYLL